MEFRRAVAKEIWDGFLKENDGSFLQSFGWGEFQERNSRKIFRATVTENEKILLGAQIIKIQASFKNYFYIPYGPVFNKENDPKKNVDYFLLFLEEVRALAKEENAIFLRIEPVFNLPEVKGLFFKDCAKRVQPKKTLVLDLENSEAELLANLKKNTRYNINLAERKGVKIKISDNYSGIFYDLLKKTRERQGFYSYKDDYYRKMFEFNSSDFQAKLFSAEYEGSPVASTIAIFFGERATSLHTGFDDKYKELKAPYLLRWNIIMEAKRRGLKEYDFWGIDEKKWPGVTALKKSFGGREVEYGQGKEIVFDKKWYLAYKLARKII